MSAKISPKQTQANRGERGDLLFFASFSDNFFALLIPPPAKLGNLECPSLLDEDESSLSSKETRIKKTREMLEVPAVNLLLRATRGARNPNRQVVITHEFD